jgi:hypothetical protein
MWVENGGNEDEMKGNEKDKSLPFFEQLEEGTRSLEL